MVMIKALFKKLIFAIALVFVSPFILATYLEELLRRNKRSRVFGATREILALIPTIIGVLLRGAYYWSVCTYSAPNVHYLFGSMLARRDTTVQSGVVVGAYGIIGHANIGENVLIGPGASIVSGKYMHGRPEDRINDPIENGELTVIVIGRNSWIGQGAILLANIGENCTIGAGSVVFRDVPDNTTVMGNPARKVNI